jgi:hypothetical protein
MHRIYSLWTTGQEQARLDAEFEVNMRKLEQDGEDLNRMQALITAKKEARQCYRNSSARVRCHLTTINLPDFSPGFATVDSRCKVIWQRRKLEELFDRTHENLGPLPSVS